MPNGEGLGLGLAVARGLAEAMNGSVTAEETPGGGLTMAIDLPAVVVEPSPLTAGTPGRLEKVAAVTSVLAVDDDPAILRTLKINLRARSYEVQTAADGRSALQIVAEEEPDVIILDLGLPDMDGVAVLRQLRSAHQTPVVVLSARQESDDIVEALDEGADDYVTKPFGMEELLARVRTALRRGQVGRQPMVVTAGVLELDLGEQRAKRAGQAVHLTPTEWRLLDVLARRPGQLVRQQELLRQVWGPNYARETNYLRVYLAQLRRKLEDEPSQPRHFITEPGVGYRFIP